MRRVPSQTNLLFSADEVRREFELRGLSLAAWARAHGYSTQLVYQILSGRKRCLRGQSHDIAVQLGLKQGLAGSLDDVDAVLKNASPAQPLRGAAQTLLEDAVMGEDP